MAAALVAAPGCSSDYSDDECYDENNDGYCDDDGSSHSGYTSGSSGKKKFIRNSGVTKGAKGGIGSSSGWSSG
jgi:hypothetical protein